jgi:hypothetical protein
MTGKKKTPMRLASSFLAADCVLVMLGGRQDGYGAWPLCKPARHNFHALSIGIGYDISFDLALARTYNATVHGFDPTIDKSVYSRLLAKANASSADRRALLFKPFGMGRADDVLPFYRH